jgi:hypothetical protein
MPLFLKSHVCWSNAQFWADLPRRARKLVALSKLQTRFNSEYIAPKFNDPSTPGNFPPSTANSRKLLYKLRYLEFLHPAESQQTAKVGPILVILYKVI